MIYFYTGTPGSGKSYHLARLVYDYLSKGKTVISNFNVNYNLVKPRHGRSVGSFIFVDNKDWLTNSYRSVGGKRSGFSEFSYINGLWNFARNFHSHTYSNGEIHYPEHQTLLVFDECHVLWNSRQWNKSDRLLWLDFFAEHRKMGFDIVLTSQADTSIDKHIRERLQNEIYHRKFFDFVKPKILGSFLRFICGRELFICIERKYGMASKKQAHYGSYYIWGCKKYYDFYNTSAFFAFRPDDDFVGASSAASCSLPDRDSAWNDSVLEVCSLPGRPVSEANQVNRKW